MVLKLSASEGWKKGLCLTCGGNVDVLNQCADGICACCGPVEFDVQVRNGEHVEGYSAEAWREQQIYMATRVKLVEIDPDDVVPF